MTDTTTPHETAPGFVVTPPAYLAMRSAAERLQADADAIRETFAPTLLAAENATRAHVAVTEKVTKSLAATVRALQGLRRSNHPSMSFSPGRAEDLTRLNREARAIAHGNARIGVRVTRLLGALLVSGGYGQASADLAALAFRGCPDARAEWRQRLAEGDPLALVVVEILTDLERLEAKADALAAEVAALVAAPYLTGLPETAEPPPPPRIHLAGSLEPCAPPVASWSATAGTVLPAFRSPMR